MTKSYLQRCLPWPLLCRDKKLLLIFIKARLTLQECTQALHPQVIYPKQANPALFQQEIKFHLGTFALEKINHHLLIN